MNNSLSVVAVAYGVMWLLSFWIQNAIYSTIIGGFGVALLIFVAIGVNSSFADIDENDEKTRIEMEKLRKEIAELRERKN